VGLKITPTRSPSPRLMAVLETSTSRIICRTPMFVAVGKRWEKSRVPGAVQPGVAAWDVRPGFACGRVGWCGYFGV
jgi:hypothetical protein